MEEMISYQRALYYPYINFSDVKWLKTAALFYDGISRIVPPGYSTFTDQEIVKRFNADEEFIKSISPNYETLAFGTNFLEFVKNELSNEQNRSAFMKKMGLVIPNNQSFSIHDFKISSILRDGLVNLGLAKVSINADTHDFEPITAAMYMTFLANEVAKDAYLPIITDDPIFQPLITGAQLNLNKKEVTGKNDISFMLASLVIQRSIPDKIENIPISKIMEFRKKYASEQYEFYLEINNLVNDLKTINSISLLNEILENRKKKIDSALKMIRNSYKFFKVSTSNILLGISVPGLAMGYGVGVATAGAITLGVGKVAGQLLENKYKRLENPYSYILSLNHKLKSETFIEQLIRGKIIF